MSTLEGKFSISVLILVIDSVVTQSFLNAIYWLYIYKFLNKQDLLVQCLILFYFLNKDSK